MYTFPLSVRARRLFYILAAIIVTIPCLILAGLGMNAVSLNLTLGELLQFFPAIRFAFALVVMIAMLWLYIYTSYMIMSEGQSLQIEGSRVEYKRPGLALAFGLMRQQVTLDATRITTIRLDPSTVGGLNWSRCELHLSDGSNEVSVPLHRAANREGTPVEHMDAWNMHPIVLALQKASGAKATISR